MSAPKWTDGKWWLEHHHGSQVHNRVTSYVIHSDLDDEDHSPDDPIGEVYGPITTHIGDQLDREMEANAHLIADAPGMYAALEGLVEEVGGLSDMADGTQSDGLRRAVNAARALIAQHKETTG